MTPDEWKEGRRRGGGGGGGSTVRLTLPLFALSMGEKREEQGGDQKRSW